MEGLDLNYSGKLIVIDTYQPIPGLNYSGNGCFLTSLAVILRFIISDAVSMNSDAGGNSSLLCGNSASAQKRDNVNKEIDIPTDGEWQNLYRYLLSSSFSVEVSTAPLPTLVFSKRLACESTCNN